MAITVTLVGPQKIGLMRRRTASVARIAAEMEIRQCVDY